MKIDNKYVFVYRIAVALIWGEALGGVISGPIKALGLLLRPRDEERMKSLEDRISKLEATEKAQHEGAIGFELISQEEPSL